METWIVALDPRPVIRNPVAGPKRSPNDIEEDPQLFMYYDQANMRMRDE